MAFAEITFSSLVYIKKIKQILIRFLKIVYERAFL